MSRSGYSDDCEPWEWIRWRGAVASAIRGARGQALLIELRDALDAMPVKELIADELADASGAYCALGVVGAKRGIDMDRIDPHDPDHVASVFAIAPALAKEIEYENDDQGRWQETDAQRWQRMRSWVEGQIRKGG